MPSLGTSFGRGAATNAQWDLANSDCVVIMGSNMAEAHPIAFRFVMQARLKGATVIHADPRFTRTSALADIYAPLRAGSDLAFLGGLINYILAGDRWFREYALSYTNLAMIVDQSFKDAAQLDGLFSGWDQASRTYDTRSWQYAAARARTPVGAAGDETGVSSGANESFSVHQQRQAAPPPGDPTLQDPNCVYQILRRQYAPYTPEMVEQVTGCPRETFLKVAEAICANSGRERTTAWCYAVGWTQHTTGVQTIRAAAIIQALLGNIGRPGGGIVALRGHTSIQGSTDIPTLYDLLPGYLPQPSALKHHTFSDYLGEAGDTSYWHNFPKFAVSLLRAWYGEHAAPNNEWAFHNVPKIVGDHSQLPMTLALANGTLRGLFLIGQNPAVGGHNASGIRKALPRLEWLVVRDFFESETAASWYSSPETLAGDTPSARNGTEIFLLPAAAPGEKEGSFTNTHRLIQWHDKVVEPPAEARSDLDFVYRLGCRLKELYRDSSLPRDRAIQQLTWEYPTRGPKDEIEAAAVLKEINGYTWPDRQQIGSFADLKDDGSTACGCWIYSGVYPTADHNRARDRQADGPDGPGSHLNWGFAWPANRRALYNRASADPDGRPWSERKRLIWWEEDRQRWTGLDNVDFAPDKRPDYRPDWSADPKGQEAIAGDSPFIMLASGKSCLFVPSGLRDGPLPTHYEPVESPVRNLLHGQQDNPAARKWDRPGNRYQAVGDRRYPYVLTTYRLTEHHAGGAATRQVPWLAALQPEGFAEIPTELAAELGIASTDYVVISTERGEIETRALVTDRLRPFQIDGRLIYQIGMPWHFGWKGYAQGDTANTLSAIVGDPNTTIHEGKAFTCALRKGRRRLPSASRLRYDDLV